MHLLCQEINHLPFFQVVTAKGKMAQFCVLRLLGDTAGARLLFFVSQSSGRGDSFRILEALSTPGSPQHVCSAVSATLTEALILEYSRILTKLNRCSFLFMLKTWTVIFTV